MANASNLNADSMNIDIEELGASLEHASEEWQVYTAAKYYISKGLMVIPLEKNGKRLPGKKYNINYGSASSKRTTIDKWFHPENGKFAGWNIGLPTGRDGGIFAIDVDTHGETNGFEELEDLELTHGALEKGPRQRTPNGGMHLLFKWQENASSGVGKLGKAIDTRGGDENACRGHVVAFPSTVNGKMYRFIEGGDIPEIPSWVMAMMGVAWKSSERTNAGTGRGNENVGDGDTENLIELDQVERMLESIDPNELTYEQWLRVGQAINSQHPKEGLELWDKWSQRGKRYKRNECHVRWEGFTPTGPIRMGSLFFYAKEGGWKPTKNDIVSGKYDEIVEKMNKRFAVTVVGNKLRIIVEKDELHDPISKHYDLLGKDDFKTLVENEYVWAKDKRGEDIKLPVAQLWLSHEARRTYRHGLGLFPDGDRDGYFNTWKGFTVEPREGDCSLILNHIRDVICRNNEEHNTWVLDWMADMMQDPSNPKGTAIVTRGKEGTGKGIIANLLGELMGGHFVHLIDIQHLTGQFNSHMMDALFLFADEITWGGDISKAGKLKGLVTERYLLGERKGIDAEKYRSMVHMWIASNEKWVIPAGPDSRRWFVIEVGHHRMGDFHYFDDMADQIENGGREAFLHFLLNRKITSTLNKAPETEALEEQRAMSRGHDVTVQWWISCVDSGKIGNFDVDWPETIAKGDIYNIYEEWCSLRKKRTETQMMFYKRMADFGMVTIRPSGKDRRRAFSIPGIEEATEILEKKEKIKLED